jgi:hypothetical protein
VNDRADEQGLNRAEHRDASQRARRPYVPPQLVVFGNVAKLTQSGGISVKDFGNMKRNNT